MTDRRDELQTELLQGRLVHPLFHPISYNIKHNFGHGKQHLATTLLSLDLYAFLLHTIAQLADETYQEVRRALGARRTFFEDTRALMRYLIFDSWHHLLQFMFTQLELEPDNSYLELLGLQ